MDKEYKILINNAKTRVNGISIKIEQLAKDIEDFVIAQMIAHDKTFINPGKCEKFRFWNKTEFCLDGIKYIKGEIILYFKYMFYNEIEGSIIKIVDLPYKEQVKFLEWFINEVVIPENFTTYF